MALGAVAGCVTDTVSLGYKPSAAIAAANSGVVISVGTFVDQRGETPTWIGAVRGGYGNPVKTLQTDKPVATLVQTAFADGLRARGLLATSVFDPSGRQVFTQTYTADELEGSLLALNTGVFGSVDTLRALAEKALSEVVDKALDDTALRNSMRH